MFLSIIYIYRYLLYVHIFMNLDAKTREKARRAPEMLNPFRCAWQFISAQSDFCTTSMSQSLGLQCAVFPSISSAVHGLFMTNRYQKSFSLSAVKISSFQDNTQIHRTTINNFCLYTDLPFQPRCKGCLGAVQRTDSADVQARESSRHSANVHLGWKSGATSSTKNQLYTYMYIYIYVYICM